ncbi:substrate-binding periplasmic protein [Limimonas halophila]|uniref:substrate-binding periplasmic protein n=1 Tax=Limimonas halophila TaxID=1082479 RepID=UPI0015A2E4E8|nr:transporter substrate-binding domain-containing protein [Limimonas halophila]
MVPVTTGVLLAATGAAADPIRLVTGTWAPFTGREQPGGGPVTRLVRTAYERAGHEVKVVYRPWKRAEQAVRRGTTEAAFPYTRNGARQERYVYSDPIFTLPIVPMTRAGDAGRITSLADMRGLHTCAPQGWSLGIAKLDRMAADGTIHVQRTRAYAQCLKLLDRGRIDFLVGEPPRLRDQVKRVLGDMAPVHLGDVVLSRSSFHLIFDKTDPNVTEAVARANAAIATLDGSTEYRSRVEEKP